MRLSYIKLLKVRVGVLIAMFMLLLILLEIEGYMLLLNLHIIVQASAQMWQLKVWFCKTNLIASRTVFNRVLMMLCLMFKIYRDLLIYLFLWDTFQLKHHQALWDLIVISKVLNTVLLPVKLIEVIGELPLVIIIFVVLHLVQHQYLWV